MSRPRVSDPSIASRFQVLNLSANALTSITDNPFHGLKLLETLLLAHNQINRVSLDAFVVLTNLKVLSLSYNRFTVSRVACAPRASAHSRCAS